MSNNAIDIFKSNNREIIRSLSFSDLFLQKIQDILKESQPNPRLIPVIPTLVELCISNFPELIDRFSFILDLLSLSNHLCICYMFEKIVQNSEILIPFQIWLKNEGLVERICLLLANDSIEESLCVNLFQILIQCSENIIFEPEFCRHSVLNAILKTPSNNSQCCLNLQWKLIGMVFSEDNQSILIESLSKEILMIIQPSGLFYYQYQVYALDVLKKIYFDSSTQITEQKSLFSLLLLVIQTYPNHSIAHDAVLGFFLEFSSKTSDHQVIKEDIIPKVLFLMEISDNLTQKALFRQFINKFYQIIPV